jgi:hypothetical protein
LIVLAVCISTFFVQPASAVTWTSANGCWTATNGNQNLIMWNASGVNSWTVPGGLTNLSVLVVAGGGGGGSATSSSTAAGGGGAGEVIINTSYAVSGVLNVTVGGGGNGGASGALNYGTNGSSSVFGAITALGGGGAALVGTLAGGTGYGYAGGPSTSSSKYGGGGGGGAGGTGGGGSGTAGGGGGAGVSNSITGTATYYGGGGGGGIVSTGTIGTRGSGIGGAGGNLGSSPTSATASTGSGGGGAGGKSAAGGNGAGGVIIVSYTTLPVASFTMNVTTGYSPLAVSFMDTSNPAGTAFQWGFKNVTGNNTWTNFATTENPVWMFGIGNYSVNLTESSLGGSSTFTNTTFINVTLTPPTFTSITPDSGTTAGGTAVTITGTNFVSGASLGVTIGGSPATSVVYGSSTSITAVMPAGTAGATWVNITNGNGGFVNTSGAYTYVTPPMITLISPSSGPTTAGTLVNITGTNLVGATSVSFGPNLATINADTATTINMTAPSGSAGLVTVTVTTPNGTDMISYTYVTPLTFTSITPNSGTTAGGTAVTIVGTGFVTGSSLAVTIGGSPATSVVYGSSTSITAVTPAGTAGATWVNITNGNGGFVNMSGAYTYQAPYLAISPNEISIPLTLQPGQTTNISSLGITVSANEPFTVTVADNTRRSSNLGYMGNYTNGAYDIYPLNTVLGSPLAMAGTTNGTTVAQTITLPITSGSLLYSGSAAVTNQLLYPNTFTQPVLSNDLVMPTGSIYRIDLTFTISAT